MTIGRTTLILGWMIAAPAMRSSLAGTAALAAQAGDPVAHSRLLEVKLRAKALANNVLGDPIDQSVWIYLPPGYPSAPDRRYPVLYLLHGYSGTPRTWLTGYQGMQLDRTMDSLIGAGASREMIVVVPNGNNRYLGSMYVNSPVTGNWEDYLAQDLVGFVDSAYRTLPAAKSRGIAGHSMGGYGALWVAMRNPQVYGSIYALSPCCLGLVGNLSESNPDWPKALVLQSADEAFSRPRPEDWWVKAMVAIAGAFAPDPARKALPVEFPYQLRNGQVAPNEGAIGRWREHMPLHSLERYEANLRRLAVALDYGENEGASHIRLATAGVSAQLAAKGIPHQFEVYPKGDHGNRIRERFEGHVVPFFSRVFGRAEEP